ncbi:hypothetical protein CCR75_006097 [Bremia lactucae]|uniref:Peroxisomal membrane protein MPV17 n=1 Tax=Bremia lactucae TaxID=4779 RepID=A0A976IIM4_BRELC|nr:hypothetical protein CCR75_006097 [Bremia lactucae]
MQRLGLFYNKWLQRSPVLTKSVTSAVLFGLGDRIAQKVEVSRELENDVSRQKETIETDSTIVSSSTARTLRIVIWGGLLFAPIHFIEQRVGNYGKSVAIKKVLLDAFIFAPSINALFFTSTQLMEGQSIGYSIHFALHQLPQTLKANYTLWPIANIINYGYIPLQYRILYINCVSLIWTTVLSTISGQSKHTK